MVTAMEGMVTKKNPWQQLGGEGNDFAAREACRPGLLGKRPGCPEATNRRGYWGIGGYQSVAVN
ncbi:hypothetical protein A3Q32_05190 [Alcanivorax sp. KX64203]|nr:hypothetical protein A3Q32_05190 [Alcanivorax sp. KX64203]